MEGDPLHLCVTHPEAHTHQQVKIGWIKTILHTQLKNPYLVAKANVEAVVGGVAREAVQKGVKMVVAVKDMAKGKSLLSQMRCQ